MPARGAAVVTEMPDVGRRIHIGRPAADAPLGVGGVLQLRRGVSGVVQPERNRTCMTRGEVAHLWVVPVDDEGRLLRQSRNRHAPALRDELELPVAVELVAEEIPQADGARA